MAFFFPFFPPSYNYNRDTWHQVTDQEPENFTEVVITEIIFVFVNLNLAVILGA